MESPKIVRKESKMISLILVISILLQILIPVIMPLSSKAVNGEGKRTSKGKIILSSSSPSMNVGDKVLVDIYIEGNDIYAMYAEFIYDRTVFNAITQNDIKVKPTGWKHSSEFVDNGPSCAFEIGKGDSGSLQTNFTIATIELVVKTAVNSTDFLISSAYLTDGNYLDDLDETDYDGVSINYNFTPEPSTPTPTKYTVSYEANGTGVSGMPSNVEVEDGAIHTVTSTVPTRTGYNFKGWKDTSTGTIYNGGDTFTVTAPVTLQAQWTEKGTLKVNPNGGTWNSSISEQTFEDEVGETKTIDDPVPPADAVRIIYDVNGKVSDASSTRPTDTVTKTFEKWQKSDGSIFTGNIYTFTSGTETLTAIYKGEVALPNASQSGATFNGWYTAKTGGTRVGGAGDIYSPTSTTDMYLYAQWDYAKYSLTVDLNGGEWSNGTEYSNKEIGDVINFGETPKLEYTVSLKEFDETPIQNLPYEKAFDEWTITGPGTVNSSNTKYTFGAGDGTLTANYINGTPVTLPSATDVEKPGYEFKGWFKADKLTAQSSPFTPTSNVTIYGKYEPIQYTIEFDGNGATSGSMADQIFRYGVAQNLTANGYSRPGYEFKGWSRNASATTATYLDEANNANTLTTTKNDRITLYAIWQPKTDIQTITYNYDGADTPLPANPETYTPSTATFTLINPQKSGYTFVGWTGTDLSTPTKVVTIAQGSTGDRTYTANWTPNTYEVVFNGEGATSGTMANQNFTYGTAQNLSTNTFEKTGYVFLGWAEVSGATTTKYGDGESVNNLVPSGTINLYAVWTRGAYTLTIDANGGTYSGPTLVSGSLADTATVVNPTHADGGYTVTFDAQGGTASVSSMNQKIEFNGWQFDGTQNGTITPFVSGTTTESTYKFVGGNDKIIAQWNTKADITLPVDPRKDGYIFDGWYEDSSFTGTSVGKAGDSYTVTADITLYAKWTPITYTVHYTAPDATSGSMADENFDYGVTKTLAVNAFEKVGYKFKQWKDTETGTIYDKNYSASTMTIENGKTVTLEVVWQDADKFDIKYFDEDGTTPLTTTGNPSNYKETDNDFTLIRPTKTGYTFRGWTGTGLTSETLDVTITKGSTGDRQYIAHWNPISYEIKFDRNGGDASVPDMPNQTFRYDEVKTLSANTYTKAGYDFSGWLDANSTEYTDEQNITTPLTSNDGDVITLSAKWTPKEYTIEYSNDDGTALSTTNPNKYTIETPEIPLVEPAPKTGYDFIGWTGSNGTTPDKDVKIPLGSTGDKTYIANWQIKQATLTINPNGGTYTGLTPVTQDYDTTLTINNPDPTGAGYIVTFDYNDGTGNKSTQTQVVTFNGWEFVGTKSGSLTPQSFATGITSSEYRFGENNDEIKAKWNRSAVQLPTTEPSRPGFDFLGWYTDPENGTKITGEVNPTGDTTVYAHWGIKYKLTIKVDSLDSGTVVEGTELESVNLIIPTKTGNVVTFAQSEGTIIDTVTQEMKFDCWSVPTIGTMNPNGSQYVFGKGDETIVAQWNPQDVNLITAPTKTGYTFKGWFTEPNGVGTEVTTSINPTTNTTIYAYYTPNQYNVSFNPGTDAVVDPANPTAPTASQKVVTYDEPYGTLPTPQKTGYTFIKWVDPNGNEVTESDVVKITDNVTLTAQWEGNEITVTFDPVGGTVNPISKKVKNGEPYGTLPVPAKQGHTFKEWQDLNGNKVEDTTIVNSADDITLTAKYEKNKYKVTFKNDDGSVIDTKQVEYGDSITYTGVTPKSKTVQPGYKAKFIGWENEEKLQNVTDNITLTAKYEKSIITYTITYVNLKGSDNSQNPTTYTVNDSKLPLIDLPDRGEDALFEGWYLVDNKNAKKITSIDTSILDNIVIQAKWSDDELYLKSKKYKIGEKDIDNWQLGDVYLDKIEPNTTVEEFIANCQTNGNITVIGLDGKTVLNSNELVGTGMIIKDTRLDEEIILTAVVMDDLDGNGRVTVTDLSALNKKLLEIQELEEPAFLAADQNDDKKISATDLSTIKNAILEVLKLIYTKPGK